MTRSCGFRRQLPAWVLLSAFLAVVFFLNYCTLFYDDDYGYGAMARGGWNRFWESFRVCPHRPVPHFLLRIFCGVLGETSFDLLNTVVWIPLFALVFRLSIGEWYPPPSRIIVAITGAFFALFNGESCLWTAGSCNYLWMSKIWIFQSGGK